MKTFINLTGHDLNIRGQVVPGDKGRVARVADTFGEFDADGVCTVSYGAVTGLPEPQEGVLYIVSAMVGAAVAGQGRTDVVSPATGHPLTTKDGQGKFLDVAGYVRR